MNEPNRPLTWPEIKEMYPELAARLRDGDMDARVEFVRLSFNGTLVSSGPRPAPQRVRLKGNLYRPVTPPGAVSVVRPGPWGNPHKVIDDDPSSAVEMFRSDLYGGRLRYTVEDVRRELAGRDLACWCQPGAPCHADVLLAAANPPASR